MKRPSARERLLQIIDRYKILEETPVLLDEVEAAAYERGLLRAAKWLRSRSRERIDGDECIPLHNAAEALLAEVKRLRAKRRGK